MKNIVVCMLLIFPAAVPCFAKDFSPVSAPIAVQDSLIENYRDAIMVAPLGHRLNGSKSSVYYKRVLKQSKQIRWILRAGTEGLGTLLSSFSTRESDVRAFNLKLGIEMDVQVGSTHFYFGPEMSLTRYTTDDGQLRVREENALFSTSTVALRRDREVEESQVLQSSGHLFFGVKFDINPLIAIGVEIAGGYGRFEVETEFDDMRPTTVSTSERWDVNFTRFLFAEFYF